MKTAIRSANTQELQAEIAEYKKLKHSELVNEEFGRKEYIEKLSIQQARIKFKIRSCMIQHVKMNQKNYKQYEETLWRCDECGLQDTNTHLVWCRCR